VDGLASATLSERGCARFGFAQRAVDRLASASLSEQWMGSLRLRSASGDVLASASLSEQWMGSLRLRSASGDVLASASLSERRWVRFGFAQRAGIRSLSGAETTEGNTILTKTEIFKNIRLIPSIIEIDISFMQLCSKLFR